MTVRHFGFTEKVYGFPCTATAAMPKRRTALSPYYQGCKAQESLRCKVIVWDEATMSNKLALEAVEHTIQDIRETSAPLVALQWSSVEIFVMC